MDRNLWPRFWRLTRILLCDHHSWANESGSFFPPFKTLKEDQSGKDGRYSPTDKKVPFGCQTLFGSFTGQLLRLGEIEETRDQLASSSSIGSVSGLGTGHKQMPHKEVYFWAQPETRITVHPNTTTSASGERWFVSQHDYFCHSSEINAVVRKVPGVCHDAKKAGCFHIIALTLAA